MRRSGHDFNTLPKGGDAGMVPDPIVINLVVPFATLVMAVVVHIHVGGLPRL